VLLVLLMVVGGIILYIAIVPTVLPMLFPGYPNAVLLSQVSSGALIALPGVMIHQVFSAHLRLKELRLLKLTSPVIKIVLLLVLVPLFLLWGAVASLLVAETVGTAMALLVFWRARDTQNEVTSSDIA